MVGFKTVAPTWAPYKHPFDILAPMLSLAYRVGVLIVGLVVFLLGVVGLFLPFLQGFLLMALGLSIMSLVSKRAQRLLDALKSRIRARWQHRRAEPVRDE